MEWTIANEPQCQMKLEKRQKGSLGVWKQRMEKKKEKKEGTSD